MFEKYTLPAVQAVQAVLDVPEQGAVFCVRGGHPAHAVHTRLVDTVHAVVSYVVLVIVNLVLPELEA